MRIYCDESGFTGNHLLDRDQPWFVYATVMLDEAEAREVCAKARKDFKLTAAELKGSRLLRSQRGRDAISQVLTRCLPSAKCVVHDKKFALAGKLFEYVFEPTFSEVNKDFYELNFHLFIATLLYCEFVAARRPAESIFSEFEELVRARMGDGVVALSASSADQRPISEIVARYAAFHGAAILDGIGASPRGGRSLKWLLDLTSTSLFNLLAQWGESGDPLYVTCDESKPLLEVAHLLDARVGRTDRVYLELRGRRHLVTFNLAEPVCLASSHAEPGLQVADIVAVGLKYVQENPDDALAKSWREMFLESGAIADGCVLPDLDHADLRYPQASLNARVLEELLRRSENGESLLLGWPGFVGFPCK